MSTRLQEVYFMAKPKKQIRVIYKRVGFDPVEVTIENTLEQMQLMVGGPIEVVPFTIDRKILILCDEEGKIDGRPVNFPLRGDLICGSVLFVGQKGENFDDCPYTLDVFRMVYDWFFEEA